MLKNNLPNPSLEAVGWRAGGPSASRDRRRWVCCGSAMSWRGVACDALFIEANIILCRVLAKLPGGASASPPSFSLASVTGCETHYPSQLLVSDINPSRLNLLDLRLVATQELPCPDAGRWIARAGWRQDANYEASQLAPLRFSSNVPVSADCVSRMGR